MEYFRNTAREAEYHLIRIADKCHSWTVEQLQQFYAPLILLLRLIGEHVMPNHVFVRLEEVAKYILILSVAVSCRLDGSETYTIEMWEAVPCLSSVSARAIITGLSLHLNWR